MLSSQGRIYIYDLDGNLIRILDDPNPKQYGYFGISMAIGSGRIVATQYASKRIYIFDLDGDLVYQSPTDAHPGVNPTTSTYQACNPTVGFGRIFAAVPGADFNSKVNAGIIYCWDLDGNPIGRALTHGPLSYGYNRADLGYGGIAVAPGRLYASAPNVSTGTATYPNLVHEWCIHTSLTPYDVQALEDGDL